MWFLIGIEVCRLICVCVDDGFIVSDYYCKGEKFDEENFECNIWKCLVR